MRLNHTMKMATGMVSHNDKLSGWHHKTKNHTNFSQQLLILGTHVAGTIAAIGGNGKGVMGVIRNGTLKLHIVRIFNDDGDYTWASSLISAVSTLIKSI